MLLVQGLQAGYSGSRGIVLDDVNAGAKAGTFVCVLGRNGVGKSTLLRTVAGLQSALGGQVILNDMPVIHMSAAERAKNIAVVLTERPFSPGLTGTDIIALGRQPFTDWLGALSTGDSDHIRWAISSVGLEQLAPRLFDTMSDGEKQRVMIARAIAQNPRMMVLDEVTAFLDLPGRVEVMTLLRHHAKNDGSLVILSSHDLDLSLQLADQIWIVDKGAVHVGVPDRMIADGIVGRAFDTDSVYFSPDHGRFKLR